MIKCVFYPEQIVLFKIPRTNIRSYTMGCGRSVFTNEGCIRTAPETSGDSRDTYEWNVFDMLKR